MRPKISKKGKELLRDHNKANKVSKAIIDNEKDLDKGKTLELPDEKISVRKTRSKQAKEFKSYQMKHLKTFEFYNHNPFDEKTFLPMTTLGELTHYYMCNKCGNMYKTFENEKNMCDKCGKELNELSLEQYYNILKEKTSPEKLSKLMDEMEKERTGLIHYKDIGHIRKALNYRKGIN